MKSFTTNCSSPSPDLDRHFNTDHIIKDLRSISIKGGRVSLFAEITKFAISLGSIAVLARILTPEEFGLVAMVMAFTTVASSFRDMGLTTATVQSFRISHNQVSTLFWINLAFGVFLCVLVSAASPAIAWFYGDPRITLVAMVFSTAFVLSGIGAQHQAILRRQMRFLTLAAINVTASLISSLVAVGSALIGASYWSLVAMHLTLAAVLSLGCWIACDWRPGLPSRTARVRPLISFGGHLAGVSLVFSLTRTFDKVLLGYSSGAAQLGLYGRASNLVIIPVSRVADPITNVAVAALSRLQNNHSAYRSFYRKGILIFSSLTIPFVVFSFITANLLVYTLLGEQWTESVFLLRLLVPAALIFSIRPATYWVYASIGHSRRQFLWAIAFAPFIFLSFAVGMRWDAIGVAIAFSVSFCLSGLLELPYCYHTTPIRLSDLGIAIWRPCVSSLGAAVILYFYIHSYNINLAIWISLLVNLILFCIIYLLFWLLLPGGLNTVREIVNIRKSSSFT